MKNLLLFAIIFAMGFFTHAIFFPDSFTNVLDDTKNIVIPNTTPTPLSANALTTTITFDGETFSDHHLTLKTASYIIIKNTSKTRQMMLLSTNPILATQRPYGESEQIYQRLDQKGTFVVQDKANSNEKLVLVVQ